MRMGGVSCLRRPSADGDHTHALVAAQSQSFPNNLVALFGHSGAQDCSAETAIRSRKVAQAVQGTTEDVRSFMVLPGAARGGLQDLQQGVTGLIEGVVQTNMRATQELFRLANPGAYVELQYRFVRQYLDTLIENSVTLVRAVRRTADETLGPLEQQLQQRRSARHDEGEARQAAE